MKTLAEICQKTGFRVHACCPMQNHSHLVVRAEDRLLAYPWSSLVWYQATPTHRPRWLRVDRSGLQPRQRNTAH